MVTINQAEAKALEALATNPAYLEIPLVVALRVVRTFILSTQSQSYVLDDYLRMSEEEKIQARESCLEVLLNPIESF